MKILLLSAAIFMLLNLGCRTANDSTTPGVAKPFPTVSAPPGTVIDSKNADRDRKLAAMQAGISKPGSEARLSVDETGTILIIDSPLITCKSFGVVAANPDNNQMYRDLNFKRVSVIDPTNKGGKCSFDVSKTRQPK